MVIKSKAKNIFLDLLSEDEEDGEYTDIAIYKTKENIMITQEQKQCLVNSLISEWEYMKSSFTRDELEDDCGNSGIDVRLQVLDDSLELHTGDAPFDTSHEGCWGYATLDYDWNEEVLETLVTELVEDLISQIETELEIDQRTKRVRLQVSQSLSMEDEEKPETINYTIPTWCLCPLFNSDDSGLEGSDIEALNSFIEREGLTFDKGHWSYDSENNESYFSHSNDVTNLGDDVVDIQWVLMS